MNVFGIDLVGDYLKMDKEQMNIVFVGHVDHGKSTIIGRLLADTNALPQGKLEQVKEYCRLNSKPFEYAFLLDALKDEQSQGITIDSARCFFKSEKRDYLIIDAPGHIEFLKNMVSGAARAEAAVLVIDVNEGVQENSKRHGYLLSMLGINQIVVCVNKMDLVNHSQEAFHKIKKEYSEFLNQINIVPKEFIPISALNGDNIKEPSQNFSWFNGGNVLSALDSFKKELPLENQPFRMPVQDVYKFTSMGDNRRIIAGRIESGSIKIGERVVFLPSNKRSTIKSIEAFNTPIKTSANQGDSIGFTLSEQIYINRGEVMCKEEEKLPYISPLIKANVFWMGKQPLQFNKEYLLKLGNSRVVAKLKEIYSTLDASNLSNEKKDKIERHDVAEVLFESMNNVAFDIVEEMQATSRFVIVDDYDIAGGGIIKEFVEDPYFEVRKQVFIREQKWERGLVSLRERALLYNQIPKLLLITGPTEVDKKTTAKNLEKFLFKSGNKIYYLGIRSILRGLDSDIEKNRRHEHIRRLGEVAHILIDAGLLVIATASDLNKNELKLLQEILSKENIYIVEMSKDHTENGLIDLKLDPEESMEENITKIIDFLMFKGVIFKV